MEFLKHYIAWIKKSNKIELATKKSERKVLQPHMVRLNRLLPRHYHLVTMGILPVFLFATTWWLGQQR
jgi:hypothetical protein